MLEKFRQQIGTAGLAVAVLALIVALAGGAFAASGSGGDSKATASAKAKAKRGPRGPKGATGPAGVQGLPGAQGPIGVQGPAGPGGGAGNTGSTGPQGNGVVVTPVASEEPECEGRGGIIVGVQGASGGDEVCNGKLGPTGPAGPEGVCSTSACKLPVGVTETGTWAFNSTAASGSVYAPISFAIPFNGFIGEENVHFQTEPEFSVHCKGQPNVPKPDSGHLCVYSFGTSAQLENATFDSILELAGEEPFASPAGALLRFTITGSPSHGFGSWAVTG